MAAQYGSHANDASSGVPKENSGVKPPLVKVLPASYYDRFLSDVAKARKPSPIRNLYPMELIPGMISLLAGKPNSSTFPFTSLGFTARSPTEPDRDSRIELSGAELAEGLQYTDTAGLKGLCEWVCGLQEFSHGRRMGEGWRVSIGTGSQDLIFKAVIAILNPGDPVLVESPVYAGVIPMFHNLKCDQIEVETDANGISADSLRAILEGWPAGKPKPKVLYTVPYGCNPTGMSATLERRREVLRLAREHEVLILEDDPYFYLYYGKAERSPSYFALEAMEGGEVGRVLRFDSFSKVLSAGIRIGFASGPEILLLSIDRHTATSNLQTSSLTQMIVFKLLESWGYEGLKKHTEGVSAFYREKRDVFEKAMNRHLKGLAEWNTPEAGMFFWFRLVVDENASAEGDGDGDSEDLIRNKAVERGVLALPGTVFLPNGRKTGYVRASFSLSSEEEVEIALGRLRGVILDARAQRGGLRS